MGTLKNLSSNEMHPIRGRLVIGRSSVCELQVQDSTVSGEHARVRWNGAQWEIRDLGSRNGTYVQGVRRGSGEVVVLQEGMQVGLGRQEPHFVWVEGSAPGPMARRNSDGHLQRGSDGILGLPDGRSPSFTVFQNARGLWVLEASDEEPRTVHNGQEIEVMGQRWTLLLPEDVSGTATAVASARIDTIALHFSVSRDEEFVRLTLNHRGQQTVLDVREHLYVLLTLARARLADVGEPLAEQGWLDRERLLKMLAMDTNALNVAIYRARAQLNAAGVEGAAGVVEVRRGHRRLGVEPQRVTVGTLEDV